jgi:oxaloacetate decarboxylase beta subunit
MITLDWRCWVMFVIGVTLIILAVKKDYEPMLLLPIGFGAILVNMPLSTVWEHNGASGFLKTFYDAGIIT